MSRTFVAASSQRIDLANQANFRREYTDTFTIALLMQFRSNTSGGIFCKFDTAVAGYDLFTRAGGAGPTFGMQLAGSVVGDIRTRTTTEWSLNTTYALCLTYSGNNASSGIVFYVNGTAQGKTDLANTAFSGDTMQTTAIARIGCRETSGTPGFFGDIVASEFGFWSVALSASEAVALAAGACPARIRPQSRVAYLPLLGDSPEPDYSGSQNNGTVTGATVTKHPGVRSLVAAR